MTSVGLTLKRQINYLTLATENKLLVGKFEFSVQNKYLFLRKKIHSNIELPFRNNVPLRNFIFFLPAYFREYPKY